MTIAVRSLNDVGLEHFSSYLDALAVAPSLAPPSEILDDDNYTVPLSTSLEIEAGLEFPTKFEFGRYLDEMLRPLQASESIEQDAGLWSWLALAMFDRLCPAKNDGTRPAGASHRYILSRDYRHHYRHLVRTPWLTYSLHGIRARVVLDGKIHRHGEASEQLLSRENVLNNQSLFSALDKLYVSSDGDEWQVKRGARGKNRGGTMRRLGKILRQFDLTYDMREMSDDQILGLFPSEFDRFRPA